MIFVTHEIGNWIGHNFKPSVRLNSLKTVLIRDHIIINKKKKTENPYKAYANKANEVYPEISSIPPG